MQSSNSYKKIESVRFIIVTRNITNNRSLFSQILGNRFFTFSIVTESFYLKADLERWLAPDVARSDYYDLMDTLWQPIVDKELSFVVRSDNDDRTILGTALSFDAWDEPDCIVTSKLSLVFEFLEYLEGPIRNNKLPRGKGKILHCYMMATNQDLTPAENVIIMNNMEEEIINLAKKRGFIGIFTTNTSPLTQVI